MIETVSMAPGPGAQLRLRPPRALTARQFVALFASLAALMWLAALLGWWGGNAFAPAFALLDSALVGSALWWAWRRGERTEVISLGPESLDVWRIGTGRSDNQAPAFHAHPYWVRMEVAGDGGPDGAVEAIVLASSGHRCEVGAFLGPAERGQLAQRLRELLAASRAS